MKSIKSRLRAAVVLIVLISVFAEAAVVYYSLGRVYRRQEGANICDTAKRLCNVAAGVMGVTDISGLEYTNILELVYSNDIQAYSESRGYYIMTVDKYNRVIFSSQNAHNIIKHIGVPQEFIKKVLEGESFEATEDLTEYYGKNVITAAYPVKENDEIIGAVLCSLPLNYLSALRKNTMASIVLVMIPLFAISLLVAYAVSGTITSPVSKLSVAAKNIASGDLSQRVDIKYKNEIGELAENFNNMAQALESSDKMKNSFISDVSHELRTPLTIIIGFLQGILDGTITKENHEKYINICLDESRRLSRLVNQLLDVARLEADASKAERSVFDINEKIRKTVLGFEDRAKSKKIRIRAEFEAEKLFVSAESDNIERVLLNLLDNALKFTQEGGNIIISTGIKNGKAEISVSNSGGGISEEDMLHIWDKFYKTDKSRSADKKGAGLGLYIVKTIINNHGERITVSCDENTEEQSVYTTFKFNLKSSEKES